MHIVQSLQSELQMRPSSAILQEECSPKIDPWGGSGDRRGRKGRGQSQALQLLQGSVGDSSTATSTSAPAMLSSGLMMSLTQPLDRVPSSGTESIVQSMVSGSSSGSRIVKHVPCIEDSPQGLRLASTPKENWSPTRLNPFELHRVSDKLSSASKELSTEQVRRTFSDLTGQRYPSHGVPRPLLSRLVSPSQFVEGLWKLGLRGQSSTALRQRRAC